MPFDPDNLPWRYRDDAYYQKGAFSVEFTIEPEGPELDPTARRRALHQLLLALRDETSLKVSSYIDVWDHHLGYRAEEDSEEPVGPDDPEETMEAQAEFAIYNKLGVTSLAKLRKFMDQHLLGDIEPRITLVDPETGQKFKATRFTIRYLFNQFMAHKKPNDWERLRELMSQDDRGYGELMGGSHRGASIMRRKRAVREPKTLEQISTTAMKHHPKPTQGTQLIQQLVLDANIPADRVDEVAEWLAEYANSLIEENLHNIPAALDGVLYDFVEGWLGDDWDRVGGHIHMSRAALVDLLIRLFRPAVMTGRFNRSAVVDAVKTFLADLVDGAEYLDATLGPIELGYDEFEETDDGGYTTPDGYSIDVPQHDLWFSDYEVTYLTEDLLKIVLEPIRATRKAVRESVSDALKELEIEQSRQRSYGELMSRGARGANTMRNHTVTFRDRYANFDDILAQLEDAEPLIRDMEAQFDAVLDTINEGNLRDAGAVLQELMTALNEAQAYLQEAASGLPGGGGYGGW